MRYIVIFRGGITQNILVVKRLAQGFVIATLAIGFSNVATLLAMSNIRIGLLYLLVLGIPFSATVFLLTRNRRNSSQKSETNYKIARILSALQGGALA